MYILYCLGMGVILVSIFANMVDSFNFDQRIKLKIIIVYTVFYLAIVSVLGLIGVIPTQIIVVLAITLLVLQYICILYLAPDHNAFMQRLFLSIVVSAILFFLPLIILLFIILNQL